MADQVVGHAGAVGGEVSRGAADGEELAEAILAVRKVIAERAQADAERIFRKAHASAVIGPEPAAFEPAGIADQPAAQPRLRIGFEELEGYAIALDSGQGDFRQVRRRRPGRCGASNSAVRPESSSTFSTGSDGFETISFPWMP